MSRTTKILSLSLLPPMLKEVERAAKEDQKSKSQLLRDALSFYLEEREWRRLQNYGRKKVAELQLTQKDVERLVDEIRVGR
ncbi:MAG: ribbon-helix-helix protein, CopG family [Candidatus Kerfeldbacteria bacterium]|nr:ribbon-helix-helix protein, CopG family [Candidatus Kerfeldbacteria bacterium]